MYLPTSGTWLGVITADEFTEGLIKVLVLIPIWILSTKPFVLGGGDVGGGYGNCPAFPNLIV